MTGSFPWSRAAALAQLPVDTGVHGELVVREPDRSGTRSPCSSPP
ncbi:hypothetical protein [Streptomyces sp. NPDC005890]